VFAEGTSAGRHWNDTPKPWRFTVPRLCPLFRGAMIQAQCGGLIQVFRV
jgi:hypothetical protein